MANASRRGILAALAAAPVAAVTTPIAAEAVSPNLAKLIANYQDADRAHQQAEDLTEEPFARFMSMGGYPDFPEAFYAREGDRQLGIYASRRSADRTWCSAEMLNQLRNAPRLTATIRETPEKVALPGEQYGGYFEHPDGSKTHRYQTSVPWPESQARADEVIAAHSWKEAEQERRLATSGYAAALEASGRLAGVSDRALHAVMQAEVHSVADVVAKLRVYASVYGNADAMLTGIDLDVDLESACVHHIVADLYRVTTGTLS